MATVKRRTRRRFVPRGAVKICEELAHRQVDVAGRFDFALFRDFGQVFCDRKSRPTVVDLSAVTDFTSAAIGMLLVLRRKVEPRHEIRLKVADPAALELLRLARLDASFAIESVSPRNAL
ncbi:MAG: STAS domain-containing protein [Planctomycetes bacterium]|nr:STAS domain-containing protein [Planctomycetota bacterium]